LWNIPKVGGGGDESTEGHHRKKIHFHWLTVGSDSSGGDSSEIGWYSSPEDGRELVGCVLLDCEIVGWEAQG
jgi:hypothetical protein